MSHFTPLSPTELQNNKIAFNSSLPAVKKKQQRIEFHEHEDVSDKLVKTPWTSPSTAEPKPKQLGKLIDMRAPNKKILRTSHIIPTIGELNVDLHGTQFFSKLDMNQEFQQLDLHTESSIPTFSTHQGLFYYERLNSGANRASEILDYIVHQLVSGVTGAFKRSDDKFVTEKTKEEHDRK